MKNKFIVTAVLFMALACAVLFVLADEGSENALQDSLESEKLEEIKGQISNGLIGGYSEESSFIAEESFFEGTAPPIAETEPPVVETEPPIPETEPEPAATEVPIAETIAPEPVTDVTEPPVVTEEQPVVPLSEHFDSSLFIGDSRTVGLDSYADLGDATVFATKGMNVYRVFSEKLDIEGFGMINLDGVLKAKKYDKVYLMLGLNEIGYNADAVMSKYSYLIQKIRESQPDAHIYLQANLHITTSRSSADEVYNNTKLNYLNSEMASLANGVDIFYIDANPIFDDAAGGLHSDYAADDFHLKSDYYAMWVKWIASNSI